MNERVRIALALALVMLLQVGLFVHVHLDRWERVIAPLKQPPGREGEGLVIRGNGLGYYAWLRSLLIDGDLDFANEFDEHGVEGDWLPPATYKTPIGRRANQWSVGPACFWAILVVPGHYIIKAIDPAAATGYTLPYQLLVGAAGLFAALVGFLCLYGICRHTLSPSPGSGSDPLPSPSGRGQGEGSRAALAATFMTLGSTLVYYWSVEVSMAHGLGASALGVFVWYWLKTYGSLSAKRWVLVGFLLGIACLMRWQLATFAVLPLGEAFLAWRGTTKPPLSPRYSGGRGQGEGGVTPIAEPPHPNPLPLSTGGEGTRLGRLAALLFVFALAAFVAFLPQMLAWKHLYGQWLVEPVPQIASHWLSPSLWDVLLSQDRSFFYWTPICALAFLGALLSVPSVKAKPPALLLLAFIVQVYALASVWGQGPYLNDVGNFSGAFLSYAYGMRHLTESVVFLAPGLAVLLNSRRAFAFWLTFALTFLLTILNLAMVLQVTSGLLPLDDGVPPAELFTKMMRFVQTEPWLMLVLVEAVGLICLVLLWGGRKETTPA